MSVAAFDAFLSDTVKPWVAKSDFDDGVKEAAEAFLKGFEAQKVFIEKAVSMKKPGDEKMQELLNDTTKQLEAVGSAHSKNSRNATSKYTQTLEEGAMALAWVTVPTPMGHVTEIISAAMFYGNKVLQEAKEKEPTHVEWVKQFKAMLESLIEYIKEHHKAGVAWGSVSGDGAAEEEDTSAPTGGNSVQAYDEYLKTVEVVKTTTVDVNGELAELAATLSDAFTAQRAFLAAVETHSKPSDEEFMECLAPQCKLMEEMSSAGDKLKKNRDLDLYVKTFEEAVQLITWVSVPTCVGQVKEMSAQVLFYANKIGMAQKGDDKVKAWGDSVKAMLKALEQYVIQEHKQGLMWGNGDKLKPSDISEVKRSKVAAPEQQSALFAELSKGTDISKGLKKVDDSQKTHKNRTGEAKPIDLEELEKKKAAAAAAKPKGPRGFPTGTEKLALEGKKWVCEYQVGTRLEMKKLEIEVDKSHAMYIYGCQFAFIKIIGKVNSITLDKCRKTQVQFESCIGSLELTSVEGTEVQVTGRVPSVSIDKSNEVMLYLSRDSTEAEINTSASTCLNVTVPGKTDEDDTIELNIPEQFVSHISGNKIETKPMDHAG